MQLSPSSSYNFCKKVLAAMKGGTLEDLKKRKKKKTSVTETEWPERIMAALEMPENTRMQPGNSSVSVAYGVQKPKIWLQKPKKQIIEELKEQYKEETQFSVSTLLTLIPKNYVAPGEGDRECNVCVKHTNEENLTRKLRAFDPSLPTSSRELSALVMCPPSPTNVFSVMEPLTWNQKCSLR